MQRHEQPEVSIGVACAPLIERLRALVESWRTGDVNPFVRVGGVLNPWAHARSESNRHAGLIELASGAALQGVA